MRSDLLSLRSLHITRPLSENGDILKNIVIDTVATNGDISFYRLSQNSVDAKGNIYIAGAIRVGGTQAWHYEYDGFIAKYNVNLELVWAKRLSAESFSVMA